MQKKCQTIPALSCWPPPRPWRLPPPPPLPLPCLIGLGTASPTYLASCVYIITPVVLITPLALLTYSIRWAGALTSNGVTPFTAQLTLTSCVEEEQNKEIINLFSIKLHQSPLLISDILRHTRFRQVLKSRAKPNSELST